MVSNTDMARTRRWAGALRTLFAVLGMAVLGAPLMASEGGEANLQLPDLNSARFLGGIGGGTLPNTPAPHCPWPTSPSARISQPTVPTRR